jgi:hypothetical protein
MTVVIGTVRLQINTIQNNLILAERGGLSHEADLQRARLHNLVGVAALLDIDVTGVTAGLDCSRPRPMAGSVRHAGSQPTSARLLDLVQLWPATGAPARLVTARRAALPRRGTRAPLGGPGIAVHTARCWRPRRDPAQRETPRVLREDARHIEAVTTWTP